MPQPKIAYYLFFCVLPNFIIFIYVHIYTTEMCKLFIINNLSEVLKKQAKKSLADHYNSG